MLPHFILTITYQGRYLFKKNFITYLFFCCVACEILVPLPGIEPVLPAVEVQCLNQWTTRDVPIFFKKKKKKQGLEMTDNLSKATQANKKSGLTSTLLFP